ncbi:MAG: hypothetical protein QXU18_10205 [Thermoplasmatales archaeon]
MEYRNTIDRNKFVFAFSKHSKFKNEKATVKKERKIRRRVRAMIRDTGMKAFGDAAL